MKKLIILGAVLINMTSCIIQKNEYKQSLTELEDYKDENEIQAQRNECAQTLIDLRNYEDTIKIEFIGIDSSIFKGKNYRMVSDSLLWDDSGKYSRYDLQNIQTGYIYRIIFEGNKYDYDYQLYDRNIYERVK